MVNILPHQQAHPLTATKRRGNQGRELNPVGQFFDMKLVDDMLHLRSLADDQNLGAIVIRIGQQLVELCRHSANSNLKCTIT